MTKKKKWNPLELLKPSPLPLEELAIYHAYHCKNPKANIPLLKELVGDCVRMVVQKLGSDVPKIPRAYTNWDNWERVRMTIIAEAILMVRSGILDKIEEEYQVSIPTAEEYPTFEFWYDKEYYKKHGFNNFHSSANIFEHLKPRGMEANIPALKELVKQLEKKPSEYWMDDYKHAWENHDIYHIKTCILCETVSLVLSGVLENL